MMGITWNKCRSSELESSRSLFAYSLSERSSLKTFSFCWKLSKEVEALQSIPRIIDITSSEGSFFLACELGSRNRTDATGAGPPIGIAWTLSVIKKRKVEVAQLTSGSELRSRISQIFLASSVSFLVSCFFPVIFSYPDYKKKVRSREQELVSSLSPKRKEKRFFLDYLERRVSSLSAKVG